MQRFDENIFADSASATTFGVQELEIEAAEGAEPAVEEVVEERSVYTDDPVRVYLREMGSVSLLNRQAEVTLARAMERGNMRLQKALSRSPLVRSTALAMYENIRAARMTPQNGVQETRECAGFRNWRRPSSNSRGSSKSWHPHPIGIRGRGWPGRRSALR
jgi:hypothetical protein